MHIHILGICGTFMGGIAQLAVELGHRVTGSDSNVYPPMSDFLAAAGIPVADGWDVAGMRPAPDLIIVGNALSRGNPAVEHLLDAAIPFASGPAWLAENVLRHRHVLAVAGTHGKTTTSGMLAFILEDAGLSPGFLIGGLPRNFEQPARLGAAPYFVIEADEYDTAFFDKRSKFIHYLPKTLLLNNLEFDHADIFADLEAIKTQFHHLIRTVPGRGTIVWNLDDANLADVLGRGCWSARVSFGRSAAADWSVAAADPAAGVYRLADRSGGELELRSSLLGLHNALNAAAAICAAVQIGVAPQRAAAALAAFKNVRRRLELLGEVNGVSVYDDFAHHPTAIRVTLRALRERIGTRRMIAVLEPRSNTMRRGFHRACLSEALADADASVIYAPADLPWDMLEATAALGPRRRVFSSVEAIIAHLARTVGPGDHVLIMSNGGFENIHRRLLTALAGA